MQGEIKNQSAINNEIIKDNPQESFALIISAAFLILGLGASFLFPKDDRIYIIATVLIVSAVLFYFCINPIPSELIYDKINFLNGGL